MIQEATYKDVRAEFEVREDPWDSKFIKEIWEGEYYFKNDMEVTSKDVVLDVGAHIGVFSVLAAKLGARVIAYEPVPENIKLLRKNIELNNVDVEINEKAVTMFGEDVEVVVQEENTENRNTGTSKILSGGKENSYTVSVPSTPLKEILTREGLDITYLKLDIEGYEYPLLYTLPVELLKTINKISMEFHYEPEAAQYLAQYLNNFGFHTKIDWAWGHQGRLQAWR